MMRCSRRKSASFWRTWRSRFSASFSSSRENLIASSMRLVGELVHHLARFGEDLLGDGVGVLGGEGVDPHLDDAGVGEIDRDHPPPVGEQMLDRGVLAEREDRSPRGWRLNIARRSSLASAISTMRWLRMKSKSTLMSEAVPEPIWVMAPRMPAAAALTCSERIEKAVVE